MKTAELDRDDNKGKGKRDRRTAAGYTADKVTFVKTELDHDDGLAEYEIEFLADGKKFDIKINAENGGVLETEVGG